MSKRQATAALTLAILGLGGCERDALYTESSFTENVAEAFSDCNESEIRFLAGKHSLMTAFGRCGSNNFASVAWSPDGEKLHFRVNNSAYQLKVADKSIAPVLPSDVHVSSAAWLHADLIALPVARGEPNGEDPQLHVALYNFAASTLNYQAVDAVEIRDLQPWGDGERLLMLARHKGEAGLLPYIFDPSTGDMERTFAFLEQPVEHLSYAPEAGLLAWSSPESTEVMRDTGESLQVLPGVLRAVPHHEGRYVALELAGEPISPFDQRSWNELSEEARERELARQKEFVERLPDWAPREYVPPELHLLDLETSTRYRITAFYGDQFAWYRSSNPRARYFGSFMLWGIEGKQLNKNVVATDLAERIRMLEKGELPLGFSKVSLAGEPLPEAAGGEGGSAGEGVSSEDQPAAPGSVESPEAGSP